jgi:hypothetical protein
VQKQSEGAFLADGADLIALPRLPGDTALSTGVFIYF